MNQKVLRGQGPVQFPHLEMTTAQKWERVAFTFCRMGTTGLICWALTPPIFILLVALAAIGFYAKAVSLGLARTRCFLRRPMLIMGFWSAAIVADIAWMLYTPPFHW